MKETGIDENLLSIRLGISRKTFDRRMSNPKDFTVEELMDIADATERDFKEIVNV